MTVYQKRISKEQAETIKSAYDQHMAIEWNTEKMEWVTYRLYPSIISILTRAMNVSKASEPVRQVSFNVKTLELHRKFLLIETDGPMFLFPIDDHTWPPVDKEKLLDGDDQ